MNLLHSQCNHPNSHSATWLFGWLHWLCSRFLTDSHKVSIGRSHGPTPEERVTALSESRESCKGGNTQGNAPRGARTLAMNLVTSSSMRRCKPLKVSEADLTFACATAWLASSRRLGANITLLITGTARPSGAVLNMKKEWCSITPTCDTSRMPYEHARM
jgi:hypothetical protein